MSTVHALKQGGKLVGVDLIMDKEEAKFLLDVLSTISYTTPEHLDPAPRSVWHFNLVADLILLLKQH